MTDANIVCGLCGATYQDWTQAQPHRYDCPNREARSRPIMLSAGDLSDIPKWTPSPREVRQMELVADFSRQIEAARQREAKALLHDQVFTS